METFIFKLSELVRTVIAVYAFEPRNPDELKLQVGDIITVHGDVSVYIPV